MLVNEAKRERTRTELLSNVSPTLAISSAITHAMLQYLRFRMYDAEEAIKAAQAIISRVRLLWLS
jgi:hypothetical protein